MTTVLALHGFTRSPKHLNAFAQACDRRGWTCVRPLVAPRWMPILMNDRRHLDRLVRRLIDSGTLVGRVVIVGHSAGAAAASWMTPGLMSSGVDVAGLVFVDGNDSPNHLIERAWTDLETVPIRAVMAPPSPCNRHGRLSAFLESRRPGSVTEIAGAGHGDFEMTGAAVYRRTCKDRSGPTEWVQVQAAVVTCIEELCRDVVSDSGH